MLKPLKREERKTMKLIWSPETASKAYLETVQSCEKFKESGVVELLSAMAAGWNAKLIVETYSQGGPIATSIGLAIAAHHTCGRHVCIVHEEKSKVEYLEAIRSSNAWPVPVPEFIVGDVETAMAGLVAVDFLVVDCKRRDFARVLRWAQVSPRGAVFACKNALDLSCGSIGFRWKWALKRGTRVVRTKFLPVGMGLDIAHIGSSNGGTAPNSSRNKIHPCRWIKHFDQRSGEEHLFRE